MGGKVAVIVIALAAGFGLILLFGTLSKNNAVAKAGTPGVIPSTPINPQPASWFNAIPVVGGILNAFQGASPSPVRPAVVSAPTTSPTGGAVTTDNFIQGPSYSNFLSQQTDAGLSAMDGNYPLSPLPPSFVVPQTGIDTTMVLAAPDGIMPPGISVDPSDYSGTGDAFYS
jgi:hypothetical protein